MNEPAVEATKPLDQYSEELKKMEEELKRRWEAKHSKRWTAEDEAALCKARKEWMEAEEAMRSAQAAPYKVSKFFRLPGTYVWKNLDRICSMEISMRGDLYAVCIYGEDGHHHVCFNTKAEAESFVELVLNRVNSI